MKSRRLAAFAYLGLVGAGCLVFAGNAQAAIPAGYTGTPYQGTAQAIPGRVELANLDEGGLNVAFFADHRRENAVAEGYSPISGDDYRPGNLDLPNICKTNRKLEADEGSEDVWEDGTRYPSEANKFVYYMGYAHTVDWVRVTVDVKQAGKYNVSSSWACANPQCGLSLWFNDGSGKSDNPQRPMDGENKSGIIMLEGTNDYHKWRAYPNFAQVDLQAGVQLLTFNLEVADHLQYGYLQFDLVGGNPGTGGTGAGGGSGAGGSGGSAGSAAGGASGAATTAGAASGGSSSGGTTATTGAAGTSGSLGVAGTSPAAPGAGGAPGAGAPAAGGSAETDSGCAMSRSSSSFGGAALSGLLLAALLRRRRLG